MPDIPGVPNPEKIIKATGKALDDNITTKEERLEKVNEDRANAREMQMNSQKQGHRFSAGDILGFYWSVIAGAFIFMATFLPIPEANQRIADTIVGFLMGTIIAAVVNFYYGSSDGSKTKSSQLNSLIGRISDKSAERKEERQERRAKRKEERRKNRE